jgi:CubicO group peptidase (beta-lactamase class C family)
MTREERQGMSLKLSGLAQRAMNTRALPFVIILLLSSLMVTLWAQGPKPSTTPTKPAAAAENTPPATTTTHELTAPDVSAFLDGVMPLQLAREDIAGAVVMVVKDGKVLFAKGYGYSDVSKKTPVSADSTLFRPGSISKLFTWTAVMQLVEQGKIDLDKDVNVYLDFKIEDKFGKPITMRNIMTHTPGFEETAENLFIPDAKDLVSLGDYVKAHQPQRIFPPGVTPAYSNYGTAVAGYIVQRVSGLPFDDYIEQNIYTPLGMTNATFRQPLPDRLKPMMSNGYVLASQPAKPFEVVQGWPAGSMSVTATDMAKFIIAHLQDGQLDGKQILKPETARLMHARAFENLPTMNAMCLGFYEETRNGHRIIGHGGDTMAFHSDLHLIPDAGVGFFISYNSPGKSEINPRGAVWHEFLDRYFPYDVPKGETIANAAQDGQLVSGRYIISRRSETTIIKGLGALSLLKVYPNDDGTVTLNLFKDMNGQPKKYREVAPLVFRDVNGQDKLAFKRMDDGNMRLVIDYPFMVGDKGTGLSDPLFILVVLIFSFSGIVLTVLLWPITAAFRWHYGKKLELAPEFKRLRLLTRIACIFDLLLVAAFGIFVASFSKNLGAAGGLTPLVRIGQLFGWLGVIGTIVALYYAYRSWTDPARWLWSKLGDTVTALACLGFAWFAIANHMLKFSLKF